jgi:hypothetical protein
MRPLQVTPFYSGARIRIGLNVAQASAGMARAKARSANLKMRGIAEPSMAAFLS